MRLKIRYVVIIGFALLVLTSLLAFPSRSRAEMYQAPTGPTTVYLPNVFRQSTIAHAPNRIVIDHNSVDLFDSIPDQYIQAASQIHQLFRHASVGNNISNGLDCLMDKTQPRPSSCDRDMPIDQIIYSSKYNRNNWVFEYHKPLPEQNPGWSDKISLFVNRVSDLGPNSPFSVYSFKFGFVDGYNGSEIDNEFFNSTNSVYPTIRDLENLEDQYPNKVFVYWTMGLSRMVGTSDSYNFNQQMRAYAQANNKILFDFADIGSHRPDGTPCYANTGNGVEALCDEYTNEDNGGHLNALGSQRAAKAMWVLMAQIAGWRP
jgi:hypothetical protein